MKYRYLFGGIIVGMFLFSFAAIPVVSADSLNSVGISPSSPQAPNTVMTITVSDTMTHATYQDIYYVVVTDGTSWWISFPTGYEFISYSSLTSSETTSCGIPFGGAGSFVANDGTHAFADLGGFCTGSNSGAWLPILGSVSASDFEGSSCYPGPQGLSVGTAGTGSTATTGTYTVIVCMEYNSGANPPGSDAYQTATFTISNPSAVPQFPVSALGPILLVALLLPALLLSGRKFRARLPL